MKAIVVSVLFVSTAFAGGIDYTPFQKDCGKWISLPKSAGGGKIMTPCVQTASANNQNFSKRVQPDSGWRQATPVEIANQNATPEPQERKSRNLRTIAQDNIAKPAASIYRKGADLVQSQLTDQSRQAMPDGQDSLPAQLPRSEPQVRGGSVERPQQGRGATTSRLPIALDPDAIASEARRVSVLPRITITEPLDLPSAQTANNNGYGYGFGLGYVPGNYAVWSDGQHMQAMKASLQWAMIRTVQETGRWNVTPPTQGRMSQQLQQLRDEYQRGRNVALPNPIPRFIGMTTYAVLVENFKAQQFRGRDIVDIYNSTGARRGSVGGRIGNIGDSTVGRIETAETNRKVILMAMYQIVDLENDATQVGPFVGVAETTMRELTSRNYPVISSIENQMTNVTGPIMDLARAVTWDPQNPEVALLEFLKKRGKLTREDEGRLRQLQYGQGPQQQGQLKRR